MQEQLRLLGYACEVAEDGAQALEKWRSGRYAMLVTDCHMPRMDGFELTRNIRTQESTGTHLPIIAVTANAMQGEAQRCLSGGMDDYLSKPLRLREIGQMLAKWLPTPAHPRGGNEPAHPSSASATVGSSNLPVWDSHALTRYVGANPAMHQHLMRRFLYNAGQQVAVLTAAGLAGEMQTGAATAHALKSAARAVGALALGEWCQQIETAGSDQNAPQFRVLLDGLAAQWTAAQTQIQSQLVLPTGASAHGDDGSATSE
jgi:CheY-like chemotaxis protein/HPt (histidine-containing phosphotransfer) domain-containing protein